MKRRIREVVQGISNLWKRSDAQDLVEYALLLIMVALAVAATTRTFGRSVKNTYTSALIGLGAVSGGALNGTGVSITNASNSAALTAASTANAALSAQYANDATVAFNNGNLAAAADFSLAAGALSNTFIAALIGGGAAFDDAVAASSSGNAKNNAVNAANNAVAAANTFIAQAIAALSGNTGGI